MYLEKPICHKVSPVFNTGEVEWQMRDGKKHCSYCGSLSPEELVKLWNAGRIRKIYQSDWKYGYPHKFYVDGDNFTVKFYTKHLHELIDQPEFETVANIIKYAGVSFENRDGELYYMGIPD